MKKLLLVFSLLALLSADDAWAQTLNEIRFGHWTEEDWFSNDYYREIRTFIDDAQTLQADYPELKPHLELMKTPFVVVDANEAIYGGLQVHFIFEKSPNYYFSAWVYGVVEDGKVVDYEVRHIFIADDNCPIARTDIVEVMQNEPRCKFW